MNRLQICQRIAQEAGISGASNGTLPASTLSQTGEMLSVVQWGDGAYEAIQNEHAEEWLFLRTNFSFNTIAGTSIYTTTDAGLPEHNDWREWSFRAYLATTGVSDEQRLWYVPWEDFRDRYQFQTVRNITTRPTHFSILPNKSVQFWPVPDAAYTIVGEYQMRPQTMTLDASEPLFSRQHHLAIVWLAVMLYAGFESSSAQYAHARNEYNRIMGSLRTNQLPPIEAPASLI